MILNGQIMAGDRIVADVYNGKVTDYDEKFAPLHIVNFKDAESWLALRSIDTRRINFRLLRKALRLKTFDPVETAMAVNGAKITDNYWFRQSGQDLKYSDVIFRENNFSNLALYGDPDAFSLMPERTPELTNTGHYEKCWKLIDGKWYLYKAGTKEEYFSELFVSRFAEKNKYPAVHYEMDGGYIRCEDFTAKDNVNLEELTFVFPYEYEYLYAYNVFDEISTYCQEEYLIMLYLDTLLYNIDRHPGNIGILRDRDTGEVVSLAPNYDNNMSLIARGYRNVSRENDVMIRLFNEFFKSNLVVEGILNTFLYNDITGDLINQCIDETGIDVDREYIVKFIINGKHLMDKNKSKMFFIR